MANANGRVVQILGGVVDVEFPADQIPELFEAIEVERPGESQISAVIESIQAELTANQAWSACFDHTLSDTVRSRLSASTPREIRRSLQAAYAAAASKIGRAHV